MQIAEIEAVLAGRKISVAQLCRRADLAPTTWLRWKTDRCAPSRAAWARIERAFAALCPGDSAPNSEAA